MVSASTAKVKKGVLEADAAHVLVVGSGDGLRRERRSIATRRAAAPLFPPVSFYLLEEGVEDLVSVHFSERLALGEDHTVVLAARNTVVGIARLAGTVDDAAHDSDGEVILVVLELVFDPGGHADDVEAKRAGAARTRDDVGPAVPKVQGGQDLVRHRYLLDRVLGERDSDGVPDAVGQKLA